MMKPVTEVFLLRGHEILLGYKKRGLGAGKFVGIGGHVEKGETVRETAVREIHEEILVTVPPDSLHPIAVMDYLFPAKPSWNVQSHFFITTVWHGTPQETAEIRPQFFPIGNLPVASMWADTPLWLPQTFATYLNPHLRQSLAVQPIRGQFVHAADNNGLASYTFHTPPQP